MQALASSVLNEKNQAGSVKQQALGMVRVKNHGYVRLCQHTPVISALGSLRQEDQELMVHSLLQRVQVKPCLKQNKHLQFQTSGRQAQQNMNIKGAGAALDTLTMCHPRWTQVDPRSRHHLNSLMTLKDSWHQVAVP